MKLMMNICCILFQIWTFLPINWNKNETWNFEQINVLFEIEENSFQIDILKDKIKPKMIIVNQFVKFVTK